MSLSNKLEELLSGYLDNQLTADELREVEASLSDPQVQAYLGSLRQNRDSLKALAQKPKPSLRPDFTKLVMAQVAAQVASSQPAAAANEEKAAVSLPKAASTIDSRIIAALVSIAAMLVLAIYFSQDRSGQSRPNDNTVVSDDTGSKIDAQQQDSVVPESPFKQPDSISSGGRLVRRDDVLISYLMTVDLEIPKNQTSRDALGPLLEQYGIQLVKGAKLTDEVKSALDDLRVTPGPQGEPLATEVYLLKASSTSMDAIIETIRSNPNSFSNVRLGMAYEVPSDPLVDKLSADVQKEVDALSSLMKQSAAPILLGQAIANSVVENQEVTVDQSFAAPLVVKEGDAQPSPFESIPEQGEQAKLVSSSGRRAKNSIHQQTLQDDEKSFALLFVRQAK